MVVMSDAGPIMDEGIMLVTFMETFRRILIIADTMHLHHPPAK
jgi:hypothetical protein